MSRTLTHCVNRASFRQRIANCAECTLPSVVDYTGFRYGHRYRSDLLSLDGGSSIPGDPQDFKVVSVTWWKERGGLKHEYLVETELQSDSSKWTWLGSGNTSNDDIRLAGHEEDLADNSLRWAMFSVRTLELDEYLTLASLGRLLEGASLDAPKYRLPTVNCYWLAQICFECMFAHYGEARIRRTCIAEEFDVLSWTSLPFTLSRRSDLEMKNNSFAHLLDVIRTRTPAWGHILYFMEVMLVAILGCGVLLSLRTPSRALWIVGWIILSVMQTADIVGNLALHRSVLLCSNRLRSRNGLPELTWRTTLLIFVPHILIMALSASAGVLMALYWR